MKSFFAAISLILPLSALADTRPMAMLRQEATCLRTACFPSARTVAGGTLPLQGLGKLRFLFFDVYAAAFYAPGDTPPCSDSLQGSPRALELHYFRALDVERMISEGRKALKQNTSISFEAIEPSLLQVEALYRAVQPGDRYRIEYSPGGGLVFFLNGEEIGVVHDSTFIEAYFGIWLSEFAPNDRLRDELVGCARRVPAAES